MLMIDAASGLTRLLAAVGGGDVAAVNQLTRPFAPVRKAPHGWPTPGPHTANDLRDLGHHTQLSMPTNRRGPGRDWHGELRMVSQNLLATDRGESRPSDRQGMIQ